MKKKRYPIYRRKQKRKIRPVKKIITIVIVCITVALCNGWIPPHTFEEAREQGQLFGNVFLTYIEENAKNLSGDIEDTVSDAVHEALGQFRIIQMDRKRRSLPEPYRSMMTALMQKWMEISRIFPQKRKTDQHMSFTVNWIHWGDADMQRPRSHRI